MVQIENIVIVTGISGAGKTTVLNQLEDLGYTPVDNIPCKLASVILDTYKEKTGTKEISKLAVGMDIRSFTNIEEYLEFIEKVKKVSGNFEMIFLNAENKVLLNRYALTRRKHPFNKKSLEESITAEKQIMESVKELSTMVIDSSYLSQKKLAEKIVDRIHKSDETIIDLTLHLKSFGFKYGVPKDVDMVFDVRFLPNPYYIPELKEKNGNDIDVQEYVMDSEESCIFKDKIVDMLEFLIPNFIKEGKKHITVAVGCSGGKHRSATFVNLLEKEFLHHENLRVFKTHREEERGNWVK